MKLTKTMQSELLVIFEGLLMSFSQGYQLFWKNSINLILNEMRESEFSDSAFAELLPSKPDWESEINDTLRIERRTITDIFDSYYYTLTPTDQDPEEDAKKYPKGLSHAECNGLVLKIYNTLSFWDPNSPFQPLSLHTKVKSAFNIMREVYTTNVRGIPSGNSTKHEFQIPYNDIIIVLCYIKQEFSFEIKEKGRVVCWHYHQNSFHMTGMAISIV